MEDTLGFDENAKKDSYTTEWQMGIHSALSVDATSNRQPFEENLYVVSQKEVLTNRSSISATLWEKLSFYCCYTSTSSKTELFTMQQNNVNRFIWFYLLNVICKSLPMTYVYIFLSSYAPDYHFFHPKMFPLSYGFNVVNIISAVLGIIILLFNVVLYFGYLFEGVIHKNPWNRCVNETMKVHDDTYKCYNLSEFFKKFNEGNVTHITHENLFYSSAYENFTLAQIEYFDHISNEEENSHTNHMAITMLILWISTALLHKQLFKRHIWKILHYTHLALCGMLLMIFIHLVVTYEKTDIPKIKRADEAQQNYLMNADFDLIAESMTAPPMVHILSSRSTHEIKPNQNSAVIVTCNAVYYLFRALTTYLMRRYCENWLKAPIIDWKYGSYSQFHFWPIYFATLYFGDLFVLIFFALHAIIETCIFFILVSCLLESMVCEWSWMKPWISMILITIAYASVKYFDEDLVDFGFAYSTTLSTLTETIIVFWLYPLGRLVDDITFHYGAAPTKLRVWSFIVVPIYYLIKGCIIIYRLRKREQVYERNTRFLFMMQAFFFGIGAAYSVYYYVFKKKASWMQVIKPAPDWGPKDFAIRQLRKQFDSRNYIGSQAPRVLSRYLINKSDLKSYKLDIPYESVTRRTTMQSEKEK